MAGYSSRQSVITDGNVGYASLWNNEYNAILAAFASLTGHVHDGSTGEGGYIPLIADVDKQNYIAIDTANNKVDFYLEVAGSPVLQFSIKDGVFEPAVDNDIDLGTAINAFKNLYIAGAATIASAAISGGTIDGTVIGGVTPAAGTFTSLSSTTGSFSGQVTSTVTTGTAPLVIASTTLVSNLNADKLDGQDAPTGTIIGTTDTQTLTNKTIVVASNIITTAASGNLTSTELNAALAELQTDIDTRALDSDLSTHISDTSTHGTVSAIVGVDDVQTLTNKTLTSPDINGGTSDNLTSLSVAADSEGNVSRWVMDTLAATATYWTKLAEFDTGGSGTARINVKLNINGSAGQATGFHATNTNISLYIVETVANGFESTISDISILQTNEEYINHDSFMLVQSIATAGTPIELWMKSNTTGTIYTITEESITNSGVVVTTTYQNGSTWTVTTPTGAVNITSDWATVKNDILTDSLSVNSNSNGNVSRWVMSTAQGGTGVEDGANTWAKLATLNLGASANNITVSYEATVSYGTKQKAKITVAIRQGTGFDGAASFISTEILTKGLSTTMLAFNSFKLIGAGVSNNENIELWVNKLAQFGNVRLVELAFDSANTDAQIIYNNAAAWQSATPSSTVNITSDWAPLFGDTTVSATEYGYLANVTSDIQTQIDNTSGKRGALVYHSTSQSVTAPYHVLFDSEDYDTSAIHDTVTNNSRLTVPTGVTKVKLIGHVFASTTIADGYASLAIYKNNSDSYIGSTRNQKYFNSTSVPRDISIISPILSVVSGDYFELVVGESSTGSVTLSGGGALIYFSMEIIE